MNNLIFAVDASFVYFDVGSAFSVHDTELFLELLADQKEQTLNHWYFSTRLGLDAFVGAVADAFSFSISAVVSNLNFAHPDHLLRYYVGVML